MRQGNAGFWVFAYGSLMWSPGFFIADRLPVRLRGWHRRFSLCSPRSWGTPERPGLCAALHEGGQCGGFALRVEAGQASLARRQLERREAAYRFREVPVETADGRGLTALTFIWNPGEPRFLADLTLAAAAGMICRAAPGRSGRSAEYLMRTITALEAADLEAGPEQALLYAVIRARAVRR